MIRRSLLWPVAGLLVAAVVAWLALDEDPPVAPSSPPPSSAASAAPATAVSAPPNSSSDGSSPERTAVASTTPSPAPAERHRIRGALVIVDGTIEHAREQGSMEVSFRVADPDQPSLPRHERQTLAVVDGAFEFTTPSLPVVVSFSTIRAGERDALCASDFAVHDTTTPVVVRAQWQQSMLLRVLADDTGSDLAGLTVARNSDWHHDRSPHPGQRPEPVLTGARSPLRLGPRTNHATELLWVRAPGYAWNRIELVTTDPAERVVRLLPGGDLAVTIDGKIPDGAVLRVRGRPGATPRFEHVVTKDDEAYWSANRVAAKKPGEHVLKMNTPDGFEPIVERRVVVEPGQWTRVEIVLRRKG